MTLTTGSRIVFFDLGPLKLIALAVLAVVIFGPEKLPSLVADAMGFIRAVRKFADGAKDDIRRELGPDFQDFEFDDLNPKAFLRRQLAAASDDYGLHEISSLKDDLTREAVGATGTVRGAPGNPLGPVKPRPTVAGFDTEAT
jgi:sec-independent protein translocase protein TatB